MNDELNKPDSNGLFDKPKGLKKMFLILLVALSLCCAITLFMLIIYVINSKDYPAYVLALVILSFVLSTFAVNHFVARLFGLRSLIPKIGKTNATNAFKNK